jgi:hypothetical protein
MVVTKNA